MPVAGGITLGEGVTVGFFEYIVQQGKQGIDVGTPPDQPTFVLDDEEDSFRYNIVPTQ